MLSDFADWLSEWIYAGAEWLLDVLLYIPRVAYADLASGAISVVNLIPCLNACVQIIDGAATVFTGAGVPNVAGQGGVLLSWLSQFLYVSAIAVGLELYTCCLVLRFLLRRIPGVG